MYETTSNTELDHIHRSLSKSLSKDSQKLDWSNENLVSCNADNTWRKEKQKLEVHKKTIVLQKPIHLNH